jgi:hypothetical protein
MENISFLCAGHANVVKCWYTVCVVADSLDMLLPLGVPGRSLNEDLRLSMVLEHGVGP